MQTIINDFEEHVKNIDLYFKSLERLDDPNVLLHFPAKRTYKYIRIETDFLKMLKANAFLILYNLVESSIRKGILAIYNQMIADSFTYEDARKEIREIWVKYQYGKIFHHTASWESGRRLATKLIEDAVNRVVLLLDEEAIPVSGNLDARKIREVCGAHGISERTHSRAQGGYRLVIVKDQRNALAHGELSFIECGRQFTLQDLHNIKGQVVIFIRSILRNMKSYAEKKLYAAGHVP